MPSVEMLKKLLDEFVEKQALIDEEMKVVVDQVQQLEKRLEACRARMSTIGTDRQKVLAIRDRYLEGNFLGDIGALKAGMDAATSAVSRHSRTATPDNAEPPSPTPTPPLASSPVPPVPTSSAPIPAPPSGPSISAVPAPVVSPPLATTIPPAPTVHTPEPAPEPVPEPVRETPIEPVATAPQPTLNDYLSPDFTEPASQLADPDIQKVLNDSGTHQALTTSGTHRALNDSGAHSVQSDSGAHPVQKDSGAHQVLKDSGAHPPVVEEAAPPPPTPLTTITGLNALLNKRNSGGAPEVPLTQPLPPAPSNTVNTATNESSNSGYGLLDRFNQDSGSASSQPPVSDDSRDEDRSVAASAAQDEPQAQTQPQQVQQQTESDGNGIVDLGAEEPADENDTVKSINDALRSLFR